MNIEIQNIQYKINLILLGVVCVVCLCFIASLLALMERRKITNCGSFSSYSAALQSFLDGNKRLDGSRGTRGVPCEALLKK